MHPPSQRVHPAMSVLPEPRTPLVPMLGERERHRHTGAPHLDFRAKGDGGDAMERNATSASQTENEISSSIPVNKLVFKGFCKAIRK